MARKHYILTARAEADLREARTWSLARWGKLLTRQYFEDLHNAAEYVAENHPARSDRRDLTGGTGLYVHSVREHYLVYEPLNRRSILLVAVIRQGRDMPAILQKWVGSIRRELADIRARIDRGEIKVTGDRPSKKPKRRR